MDINRKNYEAYFIDYLDGNLDENLVDDFLEFVKQNPDLKKELELLQTVTVKPENIQFNKKESLLKHKYDQEETFNQTAIASVEGELSPMEIERFEEYLADHPKKKEEATNFARTKLIADTSITFGKKKKLYHYNLSRKILMWSGSVAAVLVLALAIFIFPDKPKEEIAPTQTVAEIKKDTPHKKLDVPIQSRPEKIQEAVKSSAKTKPDKAQPASPEEKTPKKNLRETNEGRISHEGFADARAPERVLAQMDRIAASFGSPQTTATLATMYIEIPRAPVDYHEERLLADVLKEKTGIDKLSLNKITKAGLNLVANISNDKFQYETNEEGKIVEYNYDSRLLAFSIPVKNGGDGE